MKYTGISILIFVGNMSLAQAAPYSITGSFENPGFSDPYSLSYLFNNDSADLAEFGWGVNLDTYASSRFQFDGASGDVGLPTTSSLLINLGSFDYTNLETVLVGETVNVDLAPTAFDDDSMRVVNTPESIFFNNEGVDYELAMLGFSTDGGNSFATVFDLAEGRALNLGIYAELNRVSAVPVPAAVWLFGSALIGLVGITRRSRK